MPERPRIKKVVLGTLASLLLAAGVLLHAGPAYAKYAAMVVDAETGRVFFARNADERNHPASLTKMMTLYMVFEALETKRLRMDQRLKVSARAAKRPPSRLRLRAGQTITVEQAILALAVKSANDVATVVAEALGGTETRFARQMTRRARILGMSRTTFGNASGLPHRYQRSTARDMVTLARALRRDFPQYYDYFSRESFAYRGRTYRTHNNLLGRFDGTTGMKTGYTNAAGFNLVAAVDRSDHRLIGVVFGGRSAQSRDLHMRRILGRVFMQLERSPHIITPERVPIPALRPAPATRERALRQAMADDGVPVPDEKPAGSATPAMGDADAAGDGVPVPEEKPPGSAAQAMGSAHGDAPHNWAVQIGAYSDYDRASEMALVIVEREPELAAAGVAIEPLNRHGSRLFRARVIGLSEAAARRTCARLAKADLPCLTIAPGGA